MISKKGQQEMGKIFIVLVLAIVAAVLLLYFGYGWFKAQTTTFTQTAKPGINPIPLIAIPYAGAELISYVRNLFARSKKGVTPIIGGIWDLLQLIVIILVGAFIVWLLLGRFK